MRNGAYELVKAPKGYPGKKYRGRYAYAHRVNWWMETGKNPDGHLIHHKDEKKHNNDPSNLEAMAWGEHSAHHAKDPVIITYTCLMCSAVFSSKKGKPRTFCSRQCIGAYYGPRPISHGARSGYRRGCRCEPCRKAHADHFRRYRRNKIERTT